ncbi:hypothetical protein EZJ19_10100 [Parasulfuritortus cantonensis]|uniref:Uncharacterized protein n=1 Tax=Parasulfuritortus cantonensis TaxID=2528202 RepID=A0A4R1B9L9_9PROT|nr:hypothetical protein [Parasulfuritortus cantonensis]TCJ13616.1 hypothetical protein EZJ19_10100 [Parasulfuritortus cantonensis]
MGLIDDKSIFTAMKQNGPFAVTDDLMLGSHITPQTRAWARLFRNDRLLATKYRVVRAQIFDFLDIEGFDEIPGLLADPAARERRSERACALLGSQFGIVGNSAEIRSNLKAYAHTADGVISLLSGKVLSRYAIHVETSNEIETTHDPVELLLRVFDGRFSVKARFEAKRKLVLMGLAGSIDQRERETDIENKFNTFLEFLNGNVWSQEHKIGHLENAYLLSRHDPDDFRCLEVRVVDPAERTRLSELREGEKLTLLKRRIFQDGGRNIPVYVSVRKKDSAAKVLKLLRKNEKNPAVAVDDELGLMAVLDRIGDVKRFVRHLTRAAIKSGSFMTLEDISDTLSGGQYHGKNIGSSGQTPMLKFFARMGGMRVELIIHTNQSYLNYLFQRDIAHDEYEVKRIFDSGVAEFLFPNDIYNLDMAQIRQTLLEQFRRRIEESGRLHEHIV